ncbi:MULTISPECIES: ATP-binding protein [unclassified Pseudomonas]|uniref:ATP-binding protein n=1 Tax=unclassified Pseudomonas TaxID=196821 RepID=UPI000BC67C58|nr:MULTISPECIES: ATP-binding protein [unclassified Pseudomonas]PVZ16336.1 two-component system sensor histidine kinase BarA [Pseudomonas sp. URIL14HWK12:I12]PVZ25808.1 two-component system sensor histidine kinase BarA [Pseudomonas sp. URIL14HWK12:I10]PVZ36668.1 two-component system sensor histidine kinase BarA [Pseudomonas sp. URIL14HWK12:I11]SNZ12855.1 two-component system, NarL family, sensor histidine kinase BarA [Pseudomonas sp. URIL14HWK12:I9]
MLRKLGIRGRVILLAMAPACGMAVVLGGWFTWVQQNELRAELLRRGELVCEQLAPLVSRGLTGQDNKLLDRIAAQALEQPDVRSVSFLDTDRNLLAHAGPSMLNPAPTGNALRLLQLSGNDATRYLQPVLTHHRELAGAPAAGEQDQLLGYVEVEVSHTSMLLRGYRMFFASTLLIGGGLLLILFAAMQIARSIAQPLSRIKEAVAQIQDGKFDTRLEPMGSQELDELARGINRMAASLRSANEELQHSVDQATEDVRQNLETIEIQNIELDMARREALEASRIKSEFLANMSHEIRTPLNGILGFTHLLQRSELTPRQLDYLGTIEKSADSLLSIINEILDFSKIEAGKLVLESTPFNLRDLLQDTLTILAPAAHAKGLELVSLIYRDTPLALVGDPLRLKQILTNLVSNAIKFTREGTIVARAMIEDDDEQSAQLRISVQDTGVGLSTQDIQALFQAFSQADNSLSRQPGGTGLGLVISKRLVEQMGGEIGVDSTPGEGSTFWFSVPLPKASDDIEDLPPRSLAGRRAAVFEPHDLARQALEHQLEDCGLQVTSFLSLERMADSVGAAHDAGQPYDVAVLGVSRAQLEPERLRAYLRELAAHGCLPLVLCPTNEVAQFQTVVPDPHRQLHPKPPCNRALRRALSESFGARAGVAGAALPHPERSARILCVDDNPANLLLVQTLLQDMGAEVTALDNGEAAVSQVRQQPFDLVLMDVQMPGLDGRQTTELIRQWEAEQGRSALPIVALTAHAMANEKRALLHSGMDDYLTKPISERQLAQTVHKWTGLNLHAASTPRADNQRPGGSEELVLDHEEGLRLAAGKADLAADMLAMLLAGLDGDRQAIRLAREDQDHEALIERVHRLHGATRYCGVPQLRGACQRSETLLKQQSPAAQAALDELDQAIGRLAEQARVNA